MMITVQKVIDSLPVKAVAGSDFSKKITAEEYFNITPMVQYYMDEPDRKSTRLNSSH